MSRANNFASFKFRKAMILWLSLWFKSCFVDSAIFSMIFLLSVSAVLWSYLVKFDDLKNYCCNFTNFYEWNQLIMYRQGCEIFVRNVALCFCLFRSSSFKREYSKLGFFLNCNVPIKSVTKYDFFWCQI